MDDAPQKLDRRHVLTGAASIASLPLNAACAESTRRQVTPNITRGPFYPVHLPADCDVDLTRIVGRSDQAAGQAIEVAGRLLRSTGEPAIGIALDMWQANTHGRYDHPSDRNKAPLDPAFQGFARVRTDRDGHFRFITVKPGAYPVNRFWMRPPHLHFKVDQFTTQMLFPDEPLNQKDFILNAVRKERRPDVIAQGLPPRADGLPRFAFDLVVSA